MRLAANNNPGLAIAAAAAAAHLLSLELCHSRLPCHSKVITKLLLSQAATAALGATRGHHQDSVNNNSSSRHTSLQHDTK
jgi:hypothetical protein